MLIKEISNLRMSFNIQESMSSYTRYHVTGQTGHDTITVARARIPQSQSKGDNVFEDVDCIVNNDINEEQRRFPIRDAHL